MDLEHKIATTMLGRHINDPKLIPDITDICLDHIQDAIDHYTSEITYLMQLVEELEIDVMIEATAFPGLDVEMPGHAGLITRKKRSNF